MKVINDRGHALGSTQIPSDRTSASWKKELWCTDEKCLRDESKKERSAKRRKGERGSESINEWEWVNEGTREDRRVKRGGERKRKFCWKEAFLLDGRKTTMETPSEENQDQREDKRGTNERSQRASSVLFTAVFTGALTYSSLLGFTLHNSWVDSAQRGIFSVSTASFFHCLRAFNCWYSVRLCRIVIRHVSREFSSCSALCFFLWSN